MKEPILYYLVKRYGFEVNIFRAWVADWTGWTILSVTGEKKEVDAAIEDLKFRGAVVMEGGEELLQLKEPPDIKRVKARLTVPEGIVEQPLLCDMIKSHDVVINILYADIDDGEGTSEIEIIGESSIIEKAIAHLKKRGVVVKYLQP